MIEADGTVAASERAAGPSRSVALIAPDTYRISTDRTAGGVQLNQFLIDDEEPFLMHTGPKASFARTLAAVRSVLDPARLRWIGLSHFESDECGALNEWLAAAPGATAVCGVVAAELNVSDYAARPPLPLDDGEVLGIGRHRLRFLATPHVPHGLDAGLFFDESERTLFCSDLFFQYGDRGPVIESGIVQAARDAIAQDGDDPRARRLPYTPRTNGILLRLAALAPRTLAVMHGASFRGDGRAALLHLAAVMNDLLGRRDAG